MERKIWGEERMVRVRLGYSFQYMDVIMWLDCINYTIKYMI